MLEELRKQMLSYANEEEKWQWEHDPSYRYPCYTKAQQEICKLKERKGSNDLEWHRFNER